VKKPEGKNGSYYVMSLRYFMSFIIAWTRLVYSEKNNFFV
jgi:hypothetical protein